MAPLVTLCLANPPSITLTDRDQEEILNAAREYDNSPPSKDRGHNRTLLRRSICHKLLGLIEKVNGEGLVRDVLYYFTTKGIRGLGKIIIDRHRSSSTYNSIISIIREILEADSYLLDEPMEEDE